MNWPVLNSISYPAGHLSRMVFVSGNSITADSMTISAIAFAIFYILIPARGAKDRKRGESWKAKKWRLPLISDLSLKRQTKDLNDLATNFSLSRGTDAATLCAQRFFA